MGTYRFVHTPTLHFTWQVIQPDGLPDIPLTFAANEWLRSLSPSTVPVYLRELIAFLRWASTDRVVQANGWTLSGTPAVVRNLVREYLCSGAQCKVTARPDRNGLRVLHVRTTDQTHVNVRIFLSAMKRLLTLSPDPGCTPSRIHFDMRTQNGWPSSSGRAEKQRFTKRRNGRPCRRRAALMLRQYRFASPKTISGSPKASGLRAA